MEPPASSCRRSAFSHDCIVRSRNLQLPAFFSADGAFCCRYPTADQQRADADAEAVVQHMMDRSLPNTSRQPQKFTRVTILDSVRVARQMRDAYGLKPKDRPAMYVKCKVPDFERNVAQVRAHGFFLCVFRF